MYPRIRSLREDHGFNQTMVAEVLNMSQTGYSKYETGENDLSPSVLIRLAFFYDTSVEYLLGLTDEKNYQKRNRQQAQLYKQYRDAFLRLYEKKHPTKGASA